MTEVRDYLELRRLATQLEPRFWNTQVPEFMLRCAHCGEVRVHKGTTSFTNCLAVLSGSTISIAYCPQCKEDYLLMHTVKIIKE